MTYTVRELIEALQKCPQCFEVIVVDGFGRPAPIEAVGIDTEFETVDLFTNWKE